MQIINREQLKLEIDQLDGAYLELLYKIIRQFPHAASAVQITKPAAAKDSFSQRWRGKLGKPHFSQTELDADPRLSYLAERYLL
ncbi:MAG: hypothetical protein GY862_11875 [Gammaproteobacteria bacterium]|nr:hypothetical protein [Gammaproteobacteria bacterium]